MTLTIPHVVQQSETFPDNALMCHQIFSRIKAMLKVSVLR